MGVLRCLFSILFLILLVTPSVLPAQEIKVNCSRSAGRLKGLHRHFCGGPALLANPQKLKPFLEQIDASILRVWLLGQPDYFTGTTLEDARNPEKYNFARFVQPVVLAERLGLELFPTVATVPASLSRAGEVRGPPVDLDVFAEVIRHVVLHLTQGWADGHHFKIRYWDIWNEPDMSDVARFGAGFYTGTKEDYFKLYEAVSRAIKSLDPPSEGWEYKVGGAALARLDWAEDFLKYCDENELSLDFFSFHSYQNDPKAIEAIVLKADEILHRFPRYEGAELILNEWNMQLDFSLLKPEAKNHSKNMLDLISDPRFSSPEGAIHMAHTLILLERSPLSMGGHFNLADSGRTHMGVIACPDVPFPPAPPEKRRELRNAPYRPKMKFHALRMFKILGDTPKLFDAEIHGENIEALTGMSEDGSRVGILIVHWGDKEGTIDLAVHALPWKSGKYQWIQRNLSTASEGEEDPIEEVASGTAAGGEFNQTVSAPGQSLVFIQLEATPARASPVRD